MTILTEVIRDSIEKIKTATSEDIIMLAVRTLVVCVTALVLSIIYRLAVAISRILNMMSH